MMNFGETLKSIREAKNMTQKDLAKKAAISPRTVFNYENGSSAPKKRDGYLALSRALDVDISILLNEEEEFLIRAGELYGKRGRKQAQDLLTDIDIFFQEETIPEEDKDTIRLSLMEAYWESKKKNRKYINRRYQKDNSTMD